MENWKLNGQQDYLWGVVLYKIKFPEFWRKSYALKNKFYQIILDDGKRWINKDSAADLKHLEREEVCRFWHEHCDFCWEKAMLDSQGEFYCTGDFKHWICKECFEEFKDRFRWIIGDAEQLLQVFAE